MKNALILMVLMICFSLACSTGVSQSDETQSQSQDASMEVSKSEEVVVLNTEKGTMVVSFFEDKAPKHAESFKKLAQKGFYDGTKFHRVIKGFMIQGGDPLTKDDSQQNRWGTGGPGYTIDAEFNDGKHVKGILSMARSSDPNSAGSQFFICHGRAPHLDGQYTAFGKLVDGLDVLDKIANAPVKARGRERSFPEDPVAIKKAEVMTWGEYQKSKEEK